MRNFLYIVVFGLALSACATIIDGTSQNIEVKVIDKNTNKTIPDASCRFVTAKGMSYVTKGNPGNFTINKKQGDLHVHCKAVGYTQDEMGVTQDFDSWVIGNIIFWPGIIIDVVDGAYQEYPKFVTVLMIPE